MILSKLDLYSDDQAITGTADSTSHIDHGLVGSSSNPRVVGKGGLLRIMVLVTETFVGGTSVQLKLESDDEATFTSPDELYDSGAIVTATLVAGYRFPLRSMPEDHKQFTQLSYTVVGTFTAGKVTAGIAWDTQSPL